MSISIRSRLLLLVLAVAVPAVAGALWIICRTYVAEGETLQRTLRDNTRALGMVVDSELAQRAAIARVLAASVALQGQALEPGGEALATFERQARSAIGGLAGSVDLIGPGGALFSTRAPATASPEAMTSAKDLPAAPPTLLDMAAITPLEQGPGGGPLRAAAVKPVQQGGRTVLNVAVTILPEELQAIIDRQDLPKGWVGTVLDGHGTVVARHPGGQTHAGNPSSDALRAALAEGSEGRLGWVSLEGTEVTGYFSRSPQGWITITALPQGTVGEQLPAAVVQLVGGSLALLALAVAGALWVSRRISGPVYSLKRSAARLQAGEPVELGPTGMQECDEVVVALGEAAESIRRARSELQREVADAVERTRLAEQRISHGQRVEALGRLTGGVAHDFNNLLGVISNSAHLIRRHADTPELQAPVAATLRAVEVGSRMTQHLLRISGRHGTRPEKVNLASYLPEVQELLKIVLGKQIQVLVTVAAGTAGVQVDASEFELALINLALNAREAMPKGGKVWLEARNASAEDAADLPPGDYVLVTLGDDGKGIAGDIADRVFEPFFTTKPVGGGTGLGLSQVHGFCSQAGGAARLASTPGLGTTVSLLLPASRGLATRAAAPPAPAPDRAALAGARVLLVDDNEALSEGTAVLLRSYGALVQRASGPEAALQRLQAGEAFDVMLSDVVMPGAMDGIDLGRRVRQQWPGLPVVLISGYSSALAHAHDFSVLHKPCAPEQMVVALREAIDQNTPGGG